MAACKKEDFSDLLRAQMGGFTLAEGAHRLYKRPVGCRQLSCKISLVPARTPGSATVFMNTVGCSTKHVGMGRPAPRGPHGSFGLL